MIIGGFYNLMALIDYLVYSLASTMISVNIDIAGKEIFSSTQIETIANRIYIVVGVLMLFKLVISAIQYLINPDVFDDKEKGLTGLLKKTIISIGLMVLAPAIFNFMVSIQNSIVETIPTIVFGNNQETDSQDTADKMTFTVLSSFIKPNEGKGGTVGPSGEIHDLNSFRTKAAEGCGGGVVGSADNCKYNYMILISTLSGGFLCYVLMSMTLDVAIRTIKFSLIRILAPIPISSYIFSKDKLNKFVKTTLSVYFDLFIRLAIIYFIIFAVKQVIDSKMLENIAGNDNWFRNAIVNIAIIGGLFMFAKTAPKFISELLGLPDIGSGDMKDMFKPAWQRYGGMAGAALNPASNAIANWRQAKANGERNVAAALRALGGAGRGAVDAVTGMATGDDWKKMRQRHDNATRKSNERSVQRVNRDKARTLGESTLDRAKKTLDNLLGKKNEFVTDADKAQAARNYDERVNNLKSLANRIQSETDPTKKKELIDQYRKEASMLRDRDAFIKNESVRVAAERQIGEKVATIDGKINGFKAEIANIDTQLAAGGLSSQDEANLLAQKADLEDKITASNKEKEELTQEGAITEAENKIKGGKEQTRILNSQLGTAHKNIENARSVISAAEKVINDGKANLETIENQMNVLRSSPDFDENSVEYQTLVTQKDTIQNRMKIAQDKLDKAKEREEVYTADVKRITEAKTKVQETIDASEKAKAEAIVKKNAQVDVLVGEYNSYDEQIKKARTEVENAEATIAATKKAIFESRYTAGVDSYFGGSSQSGKGYLDLSSFLGDSRSSIYTGEAMTKMRQNADILVDVNGEPVRYVSKYCNDPTKKYSYEEISALLNDVKSSKINTETLQKEYGFASSAILQSAFEDIEKLAARDYINANIQQAYPDKYSLKPGDEKVDGKEYDTGVRLKRPMEINSAVVQWWDTFANDLYKNGVNKKELDELFGQFSANPGKFISGASSLKDKYKTIGKRIVDSAKPDDGKK